MNGRVFIHPFQEKLVDSLICRRKLNDLLIFIHGLFPNKMNLCMLMIHNAKIILFFKGILYSFERYEIPTDLFSNYTVWCRVNVNEAIIGPYTSIELFLSRTIYTRCSVC